MGNTSHGKPLRSAPEVEVLLRRSSRARRITLRVSALDGQVTLTVPVGVDAAVAFDFAEDRTDWIRAQRARRRDPVAVGPGVVLPVAGHERRVALGGRAGLGPDGLTVKAGAPPGPQVEAVLRRHARLVLDDACRRHAGRVDRRVTRITLRDTRSRWGSCSPLGRLMFSWRLILAPPEILDYVAAHEVAHLVHMDHSKAFWAVVDRLVPTYREHRSWLHRHGGNLHAWRFDG